MAATLVIVPIVSRLYKRREPWFCQPWHHCAAMFTQSAALCAQLGPCNTQTYPVDSVSPLLQIRWHLHTHTVKLQPKHYKNKISGDVRISEDTPALGCGPHLHRYCPFICEASAAGEYLRKHDMNSTPQRCMKQAHSDTHAILLPPFNWKWCAWAGSSR